MRERAARGIGIVHDESETPGIGRRVLPAQLGRDILTLAGVAHGDCATFFKGGALECERCRLDSGLRGGRRGRRLGRARCHREQHAQGEHSQRRYHVLDICLDQKLWKHFDHLDRGEFVSGQDCTLEMEGRQTSASTPHLADVHEPAIMFRIPIGQEGG